MNFVLRSQDLFCGTPDPTKEQIEMMEEKMKAFGNFADGIPSTEPTTLAVVAHIVRNDDGTIGLTEEQLQTAIDKANEYYSNADLSFVILGVNYIKKSYEDGLMQNNVENVINIYFVDADYFNGRFCGYSYFPSINGEKLKNDLIIVSTQTGCGPVSTLLAHELGHYFSLYHTHGITNYGTTDELVTRGFGANCRIAGDRLCDTEADPNLSGNVDEDCMYIGKLRDENGELFIPDPRNVMSYAQRKCRNTFTNGQYEKIRRGYLNGRRYLYQDDHMAGFQVSDGHICEGESITMTDRSFNATSYSWIFEGGTPLTSTEQNPSIIYKLSGIYDITLTITSAGGGTNTITKTDHVIVEEIVTSDITSKFGSFEEPEITEKIINEDSSTTWMKSTDAFSEGQGSALLDFYSYPPPPTAAGLGQEDYLVFAKLNTSEKKSFALTFDYAYAQIDSTYTAFVDGLEVVSRNSCDSEWISAWRKSGTYLATSAPTSGRSFGLFIPTEDDEWRSAKVFFMIEEDVDAVEFAFKSIHGYGNRLYVDNYNIEPVNVNDYDLSIMGVTVSDASCPDTADGSVTIAVSSDIPVRYRLDSMEFVETNRLEGILPGTHVVSVRNIFGVELSHEFTLDYENETPSKPVIMIESGMLSISTTDTEDLSIQWYLDGDSISGSTLPSYIPLRRGSYTVSISDGSCESFSDAFVLGENLSIMSVRVSDASCPDTADGSVTIAVSSDVPVRYRLDSMEFVETNRLEGILPGTHVVSVRNIFGVELSHEFTLGYLFPSKPVIMIENGMLSISTTDTEDLSVQWYLDRVAISGSTLPSYIPLKRGSYTVSISDGSCESFSDAFVFDVPLFVASLKEFNVYPNPVSFQLNIPLLHMHDNEGIDIYDHTGRLLRTYGSNIFKIDVSDLKDGNYLIMIKMNGQILIRRFLKNSKK